MLPTDEVLNEMRFGHLNIIFWSQTRSVVVWPSWFVSVRVGAGRGEPATGQRAAPLFGLEPAVSGASRVIHPPDCRLSRETAGVDWRRTGGEQWPSVDRSQEFTQVRGVPGVQTGEMLRSSSDR